jgi:hypothetical protein
MNCFYVEQKRICKLKKNGDNKMRRKRILPPFKKEGFENINKYDEYMLEKTEIMSTFEKKVKNIPIIAKNSKNCGDEGHCLETLMGIQHNSKNEPDIGGFEMKKQSAKITLGDFTASEYIFSAYNKRSLLNDINGWDCSVSMSRTDFIHLFGSPNPLKNNRYSWSGKCVPKYGIWNDFGQILLFNKDDDLCVYYSYSKDTRNQEMPNYLKKENTVIVIWKNDKLKKNVENKFNKKGFFLCKKSNKTFDKISFGKPFDFNHFVKSINHTFIGSIPICNAVDVLLNPPIKT